MREFFLSLFCAAVAGGLCTVLAGKAYEKHIKYISALVFTAVVVSPLFSFVGQSVPDGELVAAEISVESDAAEELVKKQLEQDSADALASYIFSETGIKAVSVGIQIESVEGEYHVRHICVRLTDKDDNEAVRRCLEALHGGEVSTEVTE